MYKKHNITVREILVTDKETKPWKYYVEGQRRPRITHARVKVLSRQEKTL
jgi:hypothetical protein